MIFVYILLGIVVFVVVAFVTFMWWHLRWLAQQSPLGVWAASADDAKVIIQFDGDRHQGTYKQLTETLQGSMREFGSWFVNRGTLKLLILATDEKAHPRLGESTPYTIRYIGPTSILISGPDRPNIAFNRAPEGTTVDIEPDDSNRTGRAD